MAKVLLAGESWITHSTHIKGMDVFTTNSYEEGCKWLVKAIESAGIFVDYLPNHLAPERFPFTLMELNQYDAVILSDIGSNTLLLSNDVFLRSLPRPNRLELLCDYVSQGGGLCMIGGYMSFTGIDAKARYGETALANILPVHLLEKDDRCEAGQGLNPVIIKPKSPIFKGIDGEWPLFLGYNKTVVKEDAELVAAIGDDPFIVLGEHGLGRTAAFTSDCSPHWGTHEFVNWKYHDRFWANLIRYISRARA